MKNIYLCGFMGCGKSTIGNLIKDNTNITVIDTDKEIENAENLSIYEIFSKFKEPYFRQLETQLLKTINKKNNLLISTGGGTLIKNNNYKIIKNNSIIIFLDTAFDICYNRIKNTSRPLVVQHSIGELKDIFNIRRQQLQKIASYTINEPTNCSINFKLDLCLNLVSFIYHKL